MTPLSLQATVDPKQEVSYIEGHVSEQTSAIPTSNPIKTELGVIINPFDRTARCTTIKFGVPDPTTGERISQKEIMDDVRASLDVPDVIIKKRACIHKPPKKLPENMRVLETIDELYQIEESFGYRRRVAGIPCPSPSKIIKNELLSRGIIKKAKHPAFKRMRGVLLTSFILPAERVGRNIEVKGWGILKGINHELQKILRIGKFWQDTGIPVKVETDPYDNTKATGWIYRMEDRGKLLGLGV